MTYTEFKDKYLGIKVDYDGAYGAQCWDLGQYYFTEVLGLPASVLSGCGLVSNMLKEPKLSLMKKYFDIIDKNNIQQGDVVIWNYGHIAIFDSKKDGVNYYFSQNPNAPTIMKINNNTYTVFRLKGTTSSSTTNTSSSLKFKIGDKVVINGSLYGTSSSDKASGSASNKTTVITRVATGAKHPYNTTGDLGWMDESSIKLVENNSNTSNSSSSTSNSNKNTNTSTNTSYYPKSSYTGTSITTALAQLGIDNSKEFRAKIAKVNGITNYAYTAAQNTKMLNLLKQGKLKKV